MIFVLRGQIQRNTNKNANTEILKPECRGGAYNIDNRRIRNDFINCTANATTRKKKVCNSIETAQVMHYKAVCQNLINAPLLADHELCAAKCNGIGAEWFPKWLRWGITKINKSLVPTSWIHDREYDIGGGMIDRWKADWHWLCNGWKAALTEYTWKQAGRYVVAGKATVFWIVLRIGGQPAFKWKRGGSDE